jgi:3-deoxy-D-manno-octulosonic-acid transferase
LNAAGALDNDLRKAIPRSVPIIVCGSTADGEEIVLLNAFQDVLEQHPSAVMILAPRHPERFDKVAGLISTLNLPLVRRTFWNASRPVSGGVFLLDSVGELASVYALADIAFVGGSLLPVGGHNILEPAQHRVAIMTGPHTFNFREIIRIFAENDALRVVESENISQQFLELLQDEPVRKALGSRARELFTRYSGATHKTLQALYPLLRK